MNTPSDPVAGEYSRVGRELVFGGPIGYGRRMSEFSEVVFLEMQKREQSSFNLDFAAS